MPSLLLTVGLEGRLYLVFLCFIVIVAARLTRFWVLRVPEELDVNLVITEAH